MINNVVSQMDMASQKPFRLQNKGGSLPILVLNQVEAPRLRRVLCVKYTKMPLFRPVFRVSACTFVNS